LLSSQAELPFRAGDVITVFGNMDDDGFYYVRSSWGKEGVLCSGTGKPSWQKAGDKLDYSP
jgi:hypothetical protein